MTALPGWTASESPFHRGELAVQDRLGVRDQLDARVRRAGIRDYLTDQHRQFFAQLPFIVVAGVDARTGAVVASPFVGSPGFVTTPDARTLRIAARPLPHSALEDCLYAGASLGVLGIELPTRRRNRVNGVVSAVDGDGFTLAVHQTFGNCAKYIQRRIGFGIFVPADASTRPVHEGNALDAASRSAIEAADTLFVATANLDAAAGRARGVDVSHRGGRPGFVRVDDAATLVMPDFVGNAYFNTLGNLLENPRAGLLFIDFASGDVLQLACDAAIVWDGPEVAAFEGAQRLVRFRVRAVRRLTGALAIVGAAPEYAPELARTGTWREAVDATGR
jgi:predicted pyridoxine 5'-phosphate oxidase superfamily flavin-nucleotide-binding protein